MRDACRYRLYLRDMVQLAESHPDVHAKFLKRGNFSGERSTHKFSLIRKDQSYEHPNKSIHAHGGIIGLYEHTETLTLYMQVQMVPGLVKSLRRFWPHLAQTLLFMKKYTA